MLGLMLVPRTQRHVAPTIAEQVPDPVLVLTGGNSSSPMPRRQHRFYLNVQMRNWGLERGGHFPCFASHEECVVELASGSRPAFGACPCSLCMSAGLRVTYLHQALSVVSGVRLPTPPGLQAGLIRVLCVSSRLSPPDALSLCCVLPGS